MKKVRWTLLALAAAALLAPSMSCTLIYSGCGGDSDCNMEAGERCIWNADKTSSECGLPEDHCEDGEARACESNLGICSKKLSTCTNAVWSVCAAPTDTCNGLDDDCDGQIDNGVPGVGEACAVGSGVCMGSGVQFCTAAGEVTCDAHEGVPQQGECDCEDDNCNGVVDDFAFGLTVTGQPAQWAPWSIALAGGRRYGAVESFNTPGNIDVIDIESNGLLASVPAARDPRLFASPSHSLVLFYIAVDQMGDPTGSQEEVHAVSISPINGVVGTPVCLGCADAPRLVTPGPVTTYEVSYGFCTKDSVFQCNDNLDNDSDTTVDMGDSDCASAEGLSESGLPLTVCTDGIDNDGDQSVDGQDGGCAAGADSEASCGFLVSYVRRTQQLYALRVYDFTLAVQPSSTGQVLNFTHDNHDIVDIAVDIVESNPQVAFFAFLRETAPGSGLAELYLMQTIATRRAQVQHDLLMVVDSLPVDTEIGLVETPNGQVIVSWANEGVISMQRLELDPDRDGTGADFFPVGDRVIVPNDPSEMLAHPQVGMLCEDQALLVYQVDTALGTTVRNAIIDAEAGAITQGASDVAGAMPRLLTEDGELLWGALGPLVGDTLTPGAAVSPAASQLACDP